MPADPPTGQPAQVRWPEIGSSPPPPRKGEGGGQARKGDRRGEHFFAESIVPKDVYCIFLFYKTLARG
jgi:hypothetical protein